MATPYLQSALTFDAQHHMRLLFNYFYMTVVSYLPLIWAVTEALAFRFLMSLDFSFS